MKSELNFPIGRKQRLDFCDEGKRWDVALHLFQGVFGATNQTPPPWLREDQRAHSILVELSEALRLPWCTLCSS